MDYNERNKNNKNNNKTIPKIETKTKQIIILIILLFILLKSQVNAYGLPIKSWEMGNAAYMKQGWYSGNILAISCQMQRSRELEMESKYIGPTKDT